MRTRLSAVGSRGSRGLVCESALFLKRRDIAAICGEVLVCSYLGYGTIFAEGDDLVGIREPLRCLVQSSERDFPNGETIEEFKRKGGDHSQASEPEQKRPTIVRCKNDGLLIHPHQPTRREQRVETSLPRISIQALQTVIEDYHVPSAIRRAGKCLFPVLASPPEDDMPRKVYSQSDVSAPHSSSHPHSLQPSYPPPATPLDLPQAGSSL